MADFGLVESAVLYLTSSLVPGHRIYIDRYFTTVQLVNKLNARGFKYARTVMRNRIPVTLRNVLPDDAEMKRQGRGVNSVFVTVDSSIACSKWFDNKPVVLMSSIYGSEPQNECRRWSKAQREDITIQRLMVIKMYDSNMGGVDTADRMLDVCSLGWVKKIIFVLFFSNSKKSVCIGIE